MGGYSSGMGLIFRRVAEIALTAPPRENTAVSSGEVTTPPTKDENGETDGEDVVMETTTSSSSSTNEASSINQVSASDAIGRRHVITRAVLFLPVLLFMFC